ncbi:MAG: signal peptidase II [Candidatus Delongbacteria bacterium]|nr:signal peptidase II [Candidatus Delongbacteria bacterium]
MTFSKKTIFFSVSAIIIIADQVSKKFLEKFLLSLDSNSINVFGEELVRFTLAYNTGIAFSIKLGSRYFLSAISLIASIFVIYLILKIDIKKKLELWAFSFILGGAIGNLIDRALYGKVIDFIDCDFPDIIMTRWPIFNIADSFVTVGMVLLSVQYLFFEKKEDEPHTNQ